MTYVSEMSPIVRDFEFLPTSKRKSSKTKLAMSVLGLFLVVSCTVAFVGLNWPRGRMVADNAEVAGNEISTCPIQAFDYLLMVQRWAPSVCATTKCVDDYTEDWLIHGLWPDYNDGTWPQFCCATDPFDVNKVKSIEATLTAKWANLEYGKTSPSFWAHEWDKHGTCASQNSKLVGELAFFTTTLNLYASWPITQWLAESLILPDDNAVLTEARVLSAIIPHIANITVELHCEKVKNSHVPYLDTITICLDKTSLKPFDCPTPRDTCKQGMIYPTKGN